jgi:DNA-binding MarR family transcriptional regulator
MVELRRNVVFTETTYGGVLLDEQAGQYWSLNPTAALALRVLLDRGELDTAVGEIINRYEISHDTASRDVDHLLTELRTAGLLTS